MCYNILNSQSRLIIQKKDYLSEKIGLITLK